MRGSQPSAGDGDNGAVFALCLPLEEPIFAYEARLTESRPATLNKVRERFGV